MSKWGVFLPKGAENVNKRGLIMAFNVHKQLTRTKTTINTSRRDMTTELYTYIAIAACIFAVIFFILDFGQDKILRADQHAGIGMLSIMVGLVWPIIIGIALVMCLSYILSYTINRIMGR